MGHPAKEGLRHIKLSPKDFDCSPRVGHPAKEGLRHVQIFKWLFDASNPEWVIQQKRD